MQKSLLIMTITLLACLGHAAERFESIEIFNEWIELHAEEVIGGQLQLSGLSDRGVCSLTIEPVGRSYRVLLDGEPVKDPIYGPNPPLEYGFAFQLTPRTSSFQVSTSHELLEARMVTEANMQFQSDTIRLLKIWLDGEGNITEVYMADAVPGFFGGTSIKDEESCKF